MRNPTTTAKSDPRRVGEILANANKQPEEPPPPTNIGDAVERLRNCLKYQAELVSRIYDRAMPFLRVVPDEGGCEACSRPAVGSPLQSAIDSATEDAAANNLMLQRIIGLLDV